MHNCNFGLSLLAYHSMENVCCNNSSVIAEKNFLTKGPNGSTTESIIATAIIGNRVDNKMLEHD